MCDWAGWMYLVGWICVYGVGWGCGKLGGLHMEHGMGVGLVVTGKCEIDSLHSVVTKWWLIGI